MCDGHRTAVASPRAAVVDWSQRIPGGGDDDETGQGRLMRVCVYAASSAKVAPGFHAAARALGATLAREGCSIVYGGGSQGLMGSLADGALAEGGEVVGILPRFMADLEWGHPGLTHLELVEDMRERKHKLLTGSDAVVALPGGCGTLEELFEAITLKRLGIYFSPILLLNTRGFYAPRVRGS